MWLSCGYPCQRQYEESGMEGYEQGIEDSAGARIIGIGCVQNLI